MIRSFKGNLARMILDERRIPKGFPTSFAKIARRKLIQLNNADDLGDLTVPPGNRFEALRFVRLVPCSSGQNFAGSVVLSRGTIDGMGVTRPGVGPSRVGGPAKVVSGINGTTIRPKH